MSKGGSYIGGHTVERVMSARTRHAITGRRIRKWKRDAEKRGGYVAQQARLYRESPQRESVLIPRKPE